MVPLGPSKAIGRLLVALPEVLLSGRHGGALRYRAATRLLDERGRFFPHHWAQTVAATVHPSAILRSPDPAQRHLDYHAFVKDLIAVRERLQRKSKSA